MQKDARCTFTINERAALHTPVNLTTPLLLSTVSTQERDIVFEYVLPTLAQHTSSEDVRILFTSLLSEIRGFAGAQLSYSTREALYCRAEWAATGAPHTILTFQRVDSAQHLLNAVEELTASTLKISSASAAEAYTYAQKTATFVFYLRAFGSQVYEPFLTKEEAKYLAEQQVATTEDKTLLAQSYQNYVLQPGEKKQGYYTPSRCDSGGVDLVRREREYSAELDGRSFVYRPGGLLNFQGPRKDEFVASTLRQFKPLAVRCGGTPHVTSVYSYNGLQSALVGRNIARRRFSTRPSGQPVQYHFLQSRGATNAKRAGVTKVATLDIETVVGPNGQLLPYLVGFYSAEFGFVSFFTDQPEDSAKREAMLQQAVDYLLRKLAGYAVFGHNLFKFDFPLLATTLLQTILAETSPARAGGKYPVEFTRNHVKLIAVRIHLRGHTLLLLDSVNFLPMSLELVGQAFCQRGKLAAPVNYKELTTESLQNSNLVVQMRSYNEEDCRLLHASLQTFAKIVEAKFGVPPFATPTITTLSYRIFLHTTEQLRARQIVVPDLRATEFIRAAYRGGRTEVIQHLVIKTEETKLFFVDFVSLYPAMALYRPLPSGYIRSVRKGQFSESNLGIYYCDVTYLPSKAESQALPYLPVRYGEAILYPEGR